MQKENSKNAKINKIKLQSTKIKKKRKTKIPKAKMNKAKAYNQRNAHSLVLTLCDLHFD